MTPLPVQRLFPIASAARALDVSVKSVRIAVSHKQIDSVMLGRRKYIPAATLEKLLAGEQSTSAAR